MSSQASVRLCEVSTRLEQDWRDLYTSAFPLAEQEPEEKPQMLIDSRRLLYHKTVGKQGELLCFSLVSLAPDFSFLAYIATDPKQRSGGYGSKHMRALIDLLKLQYPNHIGLFLEIESTNPRLIKLSDEEKNVRQRRLSFYRRLGAKRLCRSMQYLTPNRDGDGEHELDILFFNFSAKALDHKEKQKIVSEVYERFYELPLDNPLVVKVISKITSCTHQKCEEEAPDSAISTPGAEVSVPGAQDSPGKTEIVPAAANEQFFKKSSDPADKPSPQS